ncbi:MAG TPA: exodeoxyribonuclease V subunit gamma [Acidimicrobiales bacterium]|nr:exodeoxyribonuclease V subunit gamma [Acidimicrobiales bacterium]
MLHVHRSERADQLVAALGDLLAQPLEDPMASEVVAVPTRGVERWVTQRLSHRLGTSADRADGVCANIDFPFPGSLVGAATSLACGFDPKADPWPPERSVWPLLELVDAHLDEAFLAPLAAHLRSASAPSAEGEARLRRFSTVRHLADLYDRYGVHRPDLIRAWAKGDRQGPPDPQQHWQAELWLRLRHRIGEPSPAERFEEASVRLAEHPELLELPSRLSLFGLTRLPSSHLRVLEAVAVARDVHLFLLHPSGALWEKVAAAAPRPPWDLARDDDPTAGLPSHPLLRSWGRDAREMQLVLASHGVGGGEHRAVTDEPESPTTLLGLIQADVRADRSPRGKGAPDAAGDGRPVLDQTDSSIRIHSCHGRSRQVEVVRDAILHLLAADPTLEPRDVIVMCPDIESFAPLVQAVFGAGETEEETTAGGLPRLRVRLADRSLRQTNPLLGVAALLLELAGGRVTASQVLDLATREPVSRRFRFDEEDLSQIERWLAGTGVRWGLDAQHRAGWGLAHVEANTWSSGLDRLLLGVTMAEDDQRLFGGALPYDDVSSGSVDLAGRLAELVERLALTLAELQGPLPVEGWATALAAGAERLAVADTGDAWQHEQLHRVLGEVVEESARGAVDESPRGDGPLIDRAEASALLAERLRGRPTRANFRTGDLTICTLVPMRSVPHRVVCLLGLDDGVFPRHNEQDGDDLLLAHPRVGDRDTRSEDRQLLLDALLAATEHLVITYEGRDQRTNQERPPAVPVAELLDVIDRTVRSERGRPRDVVVVRHPLQPFDPRNFSAGGPGGAGPWSFDAVNLEGARALTEARHPARVFLSDPLPPLEAPVVALESLVRFVEHPVRAFLRERLGVYASDVPDQLCDSLPVELDGLEKWAVGDRLLEARLAGVDPERAMAAERGRGLLPPGPLGDAVLEDVAPVVEALLAAVESLPCSKADAESVEVNLDLPDGRSLVGTVAGVRDGTILRCIYSRLAAKHQLAAWVRFLALAASHPELAAAAATVGRAASNRNGPPKVAVAELAPFGGGPAQRRAAAIDALAAVVDLYDRGMRQPLPLYCEASAAWARAVTAGDEPVRPARDAWASRYNYDGEDADAEHVMVLGRGFDFDVVLAERPGADECGPGWAEAEKTRFGRLARRLWDPLLARQDLR